ETLELVRDGVLDQLSIGFREGQNRRLKDGTIERVSAELREVSVVLQGAYGELATVSGVRAVSEAMTNLDAARQILAGLPTLPVV
ncbi:MAG TPA: HK97 family phage prohead protease, partial [Acidothermaceae bacterium]